MVFCYIVIVLYCYCQATRRLERNKIIVVSDALCGGVPVLACVHASVRVSACACVRLYIYIYVLACVYVSGSFLFSGGCQAETISLKYC